MTGGKWKTLRKIMQPRRQAAAPAARPHSAAPKSGNETEGCPPGSGFARFGRRRGGGTATDRDEAREYHSRNRRNQNPDEEILIPQRHLYLAADRTRQHQ